MERNDVANAKQDDDTKCVLRDVEYREDITAFWTVDDDGNPDAFIDYTDQGDFQSYHCDNCGEEFNDWAKVKEHLNA